MADPLSLFMDLLGLDAPELHFVAGDEVPPPYRALLDHAQNMTPTLEALHGSPLTVRVLHRHVPEAAPAAGGGDQQQPPYYARLLTLDVVRPGGSAAESAEDAHEGVGPGEGPPPPPPAAAAGAAPAPPVVAEVSAIKIFLPNLPAAVQEEVLAERRPLGRILREHQVDQRSSLVGLFRTPQTAFLRAALCPGSEGGAGEDCGEFLYGRHNRLVSSTGVLIADVIEILPRIVHEQ
jgi:hypothetical protein